METCKECGDLLKWVCDDTFLRHPLHTAGQLKNRGMMWCCTCDARQIIDPWSNDENNTTCATILKMVEPPFAEWQACAELAPSQVRAEMTRRILQSGDWQAPLGWKRLSCVSFMSPQTTEVNQLDNRRFFLNSLEQPSTKVVLDEFFGYCLMRCVSPISKQEFDFVFFNIPNSCVSDTPVADEWAKILTNMLTTHEPEEGEEDEKEGEEEGEKRFQAEYNSNMINAHEQEEEEDEKEGEGEEEGEKRFQKEYISDRSGKFTLTRDTETGDVVDIYVDYPDPPEPECY